MSVPAARGRDSTRRAYALAALAAVLFGYDNGIISAAILFIPEQLPLTPLLKGTVVSATVIGAMVGALGSGPVADHQGRQRTLLLAGVVFTVGALGAGTAPTVPVLVLFRFILGLGIGIASVMVPVYLAEMAPADVRGAITSLNQYMIIVGTALAAGIGYLLAFTGSWRWMFLIGVFPAVVLVAGMLTVTDTPRSLVRRGQPERARALLRQLRRDPDRAEREFAEIVALERQRTEAGAAVRLRARWVRRLLVLGAMLAVFQQITGINTIVYYAPSVLESFGLSKLTALLFTFLNGLVNIGTIAVMVQAKVVDRWGRKPVLLAGLVGMSASLFAVGAAALVLPAHSGALFAVAVAAFVVFTNTFSATWGPVLWVVLAEIFPLALRGTAMAVATLFNWLTDFFVSLTFPTFTALAGAGVVFVAYAAAGVAIFPIVWWVVPETKQRSLESLEISFRAATRLRPGRPPPREDR
ncbi:sugar porter family MFS transporter [Gandjariella thermophila]|uniref:Putative metabolite transport protein YwtG n=1 Tax=Gandjariella thermophila TaxID=1931992 RepID=A0A4D4JBG3_9PSEU|nr:sugar porter family MFS transporter [Gandjariella thermophila]GDY31776.1 putative metabolite transport protein YwtG [Gandjariella thermophila]